MNWMAEEENQPHTTTVLSRITCYEWVLAKLGTWTTEQTVTVHHECAQRCQSSKCAANPNLSVLQWIIDTIWPRTGFVNEPPWNSWSWLFDLDIGGTDPSTNEPNGARRTTRRHLLPCVLHLVPLIRCLTESLVMMREVKDRAKPVKRWTAFPCRRASSRPAWSGAAEEGGWAD